MTPELKNAIAKALDLQTGDLKWANTSPDEWLVEGETDDLGFFELRVCTNLEVRLQVGILDLRSDLETLDIPETVERLVAAVKGFNAPLARAKGATR